MKGMHERKKQNAPMIIKTPSKESFVCMLIIKKLFYFHITQWAFHQCFNNPKTFYESNILLGGCLWNFRTVFFIEKKIHKIIYDLLVYGNFDIFYVFFFVGSLLNAQNYPNIHEVIFFCFWSLKYVSLFEQCSKMSKVSDLLVLNHKSTWQDLC